MNVYDSWHRFHTEAFDDKKVFIDITHNAQGEMCRVFFISRTGKYKFIPIKNTSKGGD